MAPDLLSAEAERTDAVPLVAKCGCITVVAFTGEYDCTVSAGQR